LRRGAPSEMEIRVPNETLPLKTIFVIARAVLLSLVGLFLGGCAASVVEKTLPRTAQSEAPPKNYELAPNDIVNVTVFQEPDMTTQQQISRDGTISVPLIGRVKIDGLSVGEAQDLIAKSLSEKYLVNPQVTVSVAQYAAHVFTILGQVGAAGSYPVPFEVDRFTLPMAIARAGGNTRIGNLRNIRLTRQKGDTAVQYTINMLSPAGQQFVVEPGDLITVQETLF